MLEYADALVANRGRNDDHLIRAIIELEHLDASCEYATALLNKIQDPSANADNFITSGFIHSRCTNLEKAAEALGRALPLNQWIWVIKSLECILVYFTHLVIMQL